MKQLVYTMLLALTLPFTGESWMADNGNGTFTNPLFYDEFSDPDLIRVGDDFYLTGTTMHAMPGLPGLHSRDLVNWTLLAYACDRLDFGPEYRLEGGHDISFQWTENAYGDLMLLSLATQRHLCLQPGINSLTVDHPGPKPDRKDGSCFKWQVSP
jgi:hypothetical protein